MRVSVRTHVHIHVCVTFGDIFKMKHSYVRVGFCESCDVPEVNGSLWERLGRQLAMGWVFTHRITV